MARYALEISLEDRPGALGAVASLIGEHGGDVVDIDVLEHARGLARDEITVELSGDEAAASLEEALGALDGVEVEHLAPVGEYGHHLLVDALEVAAAVIAEQTDGGLFEAFVSGVLVAFDLSWAVVVAPERQRPLAAAGSVPPASVSRAGGGPVRFAGVDDCLAVAVGENGVQLVVGREGWPFRNRERRELTTLAHICATRFAQLDRS